MALRLTKLGQHLASKTPSSSFRLSNSIRTMASSAPRKFEFLVVVPDFPGVLDKRIAIRP